MNPLRAIISAAILVIYQSGLYWSVKLVQRGRTFRDIHTSLDDRIPFVPAMIIPYVGSFAFWVLTYYFLARSGDAFWPLAASVLIGDTAAIICFAVWPTRMERPEVEGNGVFRFAVRAVYASDTPINLCPSAHCLVSCLCAFAIGASPASMLVKILAQLIALSIYASTVMVRQHRVIDVPAGVLLGLVSWLLATRIPALPALAERIFTAILY